MEAAGIFVGLCYASTYETHGALCRNVNMSKSDDFETGKLSSSKKTFQEKNE